MKEFKRRGRASEVAQQMKVPDVKSGNPSLIPGGRRELTTSAHAHTTVQKCSERYNERFKSKGKD